MSGGRIRIVSALDRHSARAVRERGCICCAPVTSSRWGGGEYLGDCGNHLEERLLDQAQARAAYTPLFWGHSRSIPQGMILDVQPLVKSLFCPIRPSPNGFFDSEASTP